MPNDADINDVSSTMDFEADSNQPKNALCRVDYSYNDYPIGSVYIVATKNVNYVPDEEKVVQNETESDEQVTRAEEKKPLQSFTNIMFSISKRNIIIASSIGGFVLLLIIIILIRLHIAKKKNNFSDRELRIYNLLKTGWSASDCGISEEEAKDIIEKH